MRNTAFKLSEAEIRQLFEFADKKFVRWYDLQIEIVDHLASAVEQEMKSDRNLTFQLALEKVYKGFGVFGFSGIVRERQEQLARAAEKRWRSEFRRMFYWPNVCLFFLILVASWTVSTSVNSKVLSDLYFVVYGCILLLFFVYVIRDVRLQKRLLLMQSGTMYFSVPFLFDFFAFGMFTEVSSVSFTVFLTLGILIKITSFRLYKRIRSEAQKLYPSVF